MSAIRVLIVDDEKPARQRLIALLQREESVEIVGACGSGSEVLDALRDAAQAGQPVDLLFLDVQMPEMDGFDVIGALADAVGTAQPPAIVFVTAYDQYALRAFDAHAVDYLLKPFSDERFQLALARACRIARAGDVDAVVRRFEAVLSEVRSHRAGITPRSDAPPPTARAEPYLSRIVLKEHGRVRFLDVTELAWIAADGVYVTLHTVNGTTHLHRALLGEMESALDPRRFARIHRSAIVRIDWIEELQPESHGEYAVVLKDRTVLKLSRTYRAGVETLLGQRF